MVERVKKLNVIKKYLFDLTCSSHNILQPKAIIAKGDMGALPHYICPEDANILQGFRTKMDPQYNSRITPIYK